MTDFGLELFNLEIDGMSFNLFGLPGEYLFEQIRSSGTFYEYQLLTALAEYCRTSDGLAVDVGANLGNHTVFLAGELGLDVISVEPEPLNFQILSQNVSANGLEDRVELFQGAAWDKECQISLRQTIETNRGTFTATETNRGIAARPIDDLVGTRNVSIIKVDVEGAERKVLEGARKCLTRCHPIVTVEAHKSHERAELASFFEELGYVAVSIVGNSDNYLWMHDSSTTSLTQKAWQRSSVESQRQSYRQASAMLQAVNSIERKLVSLEKAPNPHTDELRALNTSISELLKAINGSPGREPGNETFSFSQLGNALESIGHRIDELSRHQSTASMTREIDRVRERIEILGAGQGRVEAHQILIKGSVDDSLRRQKDLNSELVEKIPSSLEKLTEWIDRLESELLGVTRVDQNGRVTSAGAGVLPKLAELPDALDARLGEMDDKLRSLTKATEAPIGAQNQTLSQLERLSTRVEELSTGFAEYQQGVRNPRLASPHVDSISSRVTDGDSPKTRARSFKRLLHAYYKQSRRLESLSSGAIRADDQMEILKRSLDLDESQWSKENQAPTSPPVPAPAPTATRELIPFPHDDRGRRDPVRIGIASMAGREDGLRQVIEILSPQADEIFVYLNDMEDIPDNLPERRNVRYFTGPDLGDRGKFYFLDGFSGYYLTCDDDINYAPFHVQSIIDGIERYGRKCVVGWHGSIFKPDFKEFYNPKYRQVLSFRFARGQDTPVHLLGTGVCGFHTTTIDVSLADFEHPNMADVFLAIVAKKQDIGMAVLAHGKDWATPIEVGPSISTVSLKRDKAPKQGLDVAATASQLVIDNGPWEAKPLEPVYTRKPFTVAFIGRTDKDRWKKGGILKSAHLTVDALRRFGVKTLLEDITTGDPKNLNDQEADIVMLYVGDPERPDFKDVEKLIHHHAQCGRQVIVNLSFNGKPRRSEFIASKITELRAKYQNRIWLMAFTETMRVVPELAPIRDAMILIPKTIALPDDPCASFESTKGIFIGDIAKLNDDYLLDQPGREWIAAIRRALPGVPIRAVRQYKPKVDQNLDIDEVWPFLGREEFANRISSCRLMLSTVKYATFEMVPLEVASLGVPVIYPEMPQSLTEHLGISGVSVQSPEELERILPTLYHDPLVWRSQSEAGIHRAWSAELNNTSGQLYLRLLSLINKDG